MTWANAGITLAVLVAVLFVLLSASELSFRRGLRVRDQTDREALISMSGLAQATTLGMVGLLLAFALSMAESRFSHRRALIVAEANAIGTAYLRTDLLDPGVAAEVRALFRRYVDARLDFYDAGVDADRTLAAHARSESIQREIWQRTMTQANAHRDPVIAIYVASVNDVIDRCGDRRAAIDDRVPPSFLIVLLFAAAIACCATGYACGLQHRHFALSAVMVPALLAIGITSVIDLDAGRAGLIRTGQGALERLKVSIVEGR